MQAKGVCVGILAAVTLAGCHSLRQGRSSDLLWGHLADASLVPDAPQYLINKKVGEPFKVCLAKYMSELYPGIEAEIDVAVNLWASYLGRKIPVQIELAELPRASGEDNEVSLGELYAKTCGAGIDVAIGMAPLGERTLGLTGASYSYRDHKDGTREILSFKRYLFLRDLSLAPVEGNRGAASQWKSLAQRDGRGTKKDELLTLMRKRDRMEYAPKGELLALPVLVHEVGHIWGLCDQYESAHNCDAQNSSSHPVLDAQMGARGEREMFYLTDDDIEGLRKLADRPGFMHDWPKTEALTAVPAKIVRKPVELARVDGVRREGSTLVVDFGVVTSVSADVVFSLRPVGETDWQKVGDGFHEDGEFKQPVSELTIELGKHPPKGKLAVRMEVVVEGEKALVVEADES